MRGWTSRKHEKHWKSICGQRQVEGFFERPSVKRAGELLNLSRNQLRIMTVLLTGHCHVKGHLFNLQLVDNHWCGRCKRASETASHVLVTVRHWLYFDLCMWAIICWNQATLPTSPSAMYCTLFKVLCCWMLKQRVAQEIGSGRGSRFTVMPALMYSTFFFSNGLTAPWRCRPPHFLRLHDHTF
jgi:hypothetical protein